MSPRTLFRTFAFAELVTWAGLIVGMILKYVTQTTDAVVPIAGGIHGFVFLCYVVVTVLVWIDARWRPATGLLGLGSAVIPFATFPFEKVVDRRGLLAERWRLAAPEAEVRGPLERLVSLVLRHPLIAALIAVVLVAAAFTVLLILGPPVPRS